MEALSVKGRTPCAAWGVFRALCLLVGRDNGVIGDFFSSGGHSGHCVGSLGGIMG